MGECPPRVREGGRARRVVEKALDAPEGVVTRRSGDGKVRWQRLVACENLFDHGPCATGGALEAPQIPARVGKAIGMIDPIPVDHALRLQAEESRVSRVKDCTVFNLDGREGLDVEKAAIVQLVIGDPPIGKAVVLGLKKIHNWQILGALGEREHMIVVSKDMLGSPRAIRLRNLRGPSPELIVENRCADRAAEDRQENSVLCARITIEPRRVEARCPIPQERPQRVVMPHGGGDRHVVGDDVDDEAHASLMESIGEPSQALLATVIHAHAGMIHDVVAVHGPRRRLQDR